MNARLFSFVAGPSGTWRIERVTPVVGEALPEASWLDIVPGDLAAPPPDAQWILQGLTSHERYVTRSEKATLVASQPALGRPEATLGALIPIRKSAAWWALAQDERRQIFEATSHHIAIGLRYLPGIARRLHHCRDLGQAQHFDFLTWFEFAPEHGPPFDQLLAELRGTEEWTYVEREVEVRVTREPQAG